MPKLTNVKLNLKLPGLGGIEGTWQPDDNEINAAWELYVELVTRAPLGQPPRHQGLAREALTSIYSMFSTTRGILRQYGPGVARPKNDDELSFGYFAVTMLNLVLRPMLTRWHPLLQEWEGSKEVGVSAADHEVAWPHYQEFRDELRQTRDRLLEYARLFATVADVPELIDP